MKIKPCTASQCVSVFVCVCLCVSVCVCVCECVCVFVRVRPIPFWHPIPDTIGRSYTDTNTGNDVPHSLRQTYVTYVAHNVRTFQNITPLTLRYKCMRQTIGLKLQACMQQCWLLRRVDGLLVSASILKLVSADTRYRYRSNPSVCVCVLSVICRCLRSWLLNDKLYVMSNMSSEWDWCINHGLRQSWVGCVYDWDWCINHGLRQSW